MSHLIKSQSWSLKQAWEDSKYWQIAQGFAANPAFQQMVREYDPKKEPWSIDRIVLLLFTRWQEPTIAMDYPWMLNNNGGVKNASFGLKYMQPSNPVTKSAPKSGGRPGEPRERDPPLRGFFGMLAGRYVPVRFMGGISHGDQNSQGFKDEKGDNFDLEAYIERSNILKPKRTITVPWRRDIPNPELNEAGQPKYPLGSFDKAMCFFEHAVDLMSINAVYQATAEFRNKAQVNELPDIQEYIGLCGAKYCDEKKMEEQATGFLNVEIILPQTCPAPDPMVAEYTPLNTGPVSTYNPNLKVLSDELAEKMNKSLLMEAKQRKKVLDKAATDAAASVAANPAKANGKPATEKKRTVKDESTTTRLSVVTNYDSYDPVGNPDWVPVTEPIEDLTPWIGIRAGDGKIVEGFVDWVVEKVATGQFPKFRLRVRATHLMLVLPHVRESVALAPSKLEQNLPSVNDNASKLLLEGMNSMSAKFKLIEGGDMFGSFDMTTLGTLPSGKRSADEIAPAPTPSTNDDAAADDNDPPILPPEALKPAPAIAWEEDD